MGPKSAGRAGGRFGSGTRAPPASVHLCELVLLERRARRAQLSLLTGRPLRLRGRGRQLEGDGHVDGLLVAVGRGLDVCDHRRERVAGAQLVFVELRQGLLEELVGVAGVVGVAVEQTPATVEVVGVNLVEAGDGQLAHSVLRPLFDLEAEGDAAARVVEGGHGAHARVEVALARVSLAHGGQPLVYLDAVGDLARLHAERGVKLLRRQGRSARPLGLIPDVDRAFVDVHRDGDALIAVGVREGLRRRRREGRAQVAALLVERQQVGLGEAVDVGARVVVVEDAAGLLHERLFGDGARADEAQLADAQLRPAHREEVLDLPPRSVRRERVFDRALDLALAQEVFERALDLVGDAAGFGRGAVEGRDFALDGGAQFLFGEPDEVVERDRHARLLLDDREGDDGLVGLALDAVAQLLEEAGLKQAIGRRVHFVNADRLAGLEAALLQSLGLRHALKALELDAVELQSLRRHLRLPLRAHTRRAKATGKARGRRARRLKA